MARTSHAAGDAPLDPEQAAFRRNLFVVGAVHGVLLLVFFVVGKFQPKPTPAQLVWLDGGAFGAAGGGAAAKVPSEAELAPAENVEVEPEKAPEPVRPPEAPPEAAPPPSEIVIPPVTPKPTPARVTPKPATPKPATPKTTPTTPKATPTPKPKPKASPKPTPKIAKATVTPNAIAQKTAKSDDAAVAKSKATPTPPPGNDADAGKAETPGSTSSGAGSVAGKGGNKSGSGTGAGNNEFAWYYEMLDDRFTSRWEQPLTIVRSTQQFVTTLKIRIDKDGKIVSREIANPSGNPLMDESVMAAAQKVLAVDPLPAGLGGAAFDVNINFTLDHGL